MTAETWISVDIESSGPTPATGSLIALGACLVERPEQGIELLLRPDPELPWEAEAAAIHGLDRDELLREGLEPAAAMEAFETWLAQVVPAGSRPVFVALNAPFDWMFVADAAWRHLGRNPFGASALDLKALYLGRHLGAVDRWARHLPPAHAGALPGRAAAHAPRAGRRPRAGRHLPRDPRRRTGWPGGRLAGLTVRDRQSWYWYVLVSLSAPSNSTITHSQSIQQLIG